ncbi:MAG: hypothetical protein WCF26_09205 [Candidatus Sulfotelmatobacter sp.]
MQNEENQVLRKLLPFATFVVVGHFAVVIWHLFLLLKVQPSTPWFAALLLVLANLLPVVGLFAFAKGRYNLAAGLIAAPLSVALVIGGYTHFLTTSSDNVFRMPPGALRLPFQISAVLLALFESMGCFVALRTFATARAKHLAS